MGIEKADDVVENEILNPADDARNDVAKAIQQLKGDAPAEVVEDAHPEALEVASEPEAAAADDGRARGPDGKFISKEIAPAKAAPAQEITPPVDNTAKASTEQPSTAAIGAPPVSWAAEAKTAWNSIPPAIQAAVLKRETEVSNGFKQKSDEVHRYEQALAPIAQEAQKRGLSPDDAIRRLIDGNTFLESRPAEAIVWLAQKNGIDLAQLASNPPASQPQVRTDPVVPQLQQTISSLESRLNGFLQTQTMSVIEKFASDHPHYEAVESDLPVFIQQVQQAEPGLAPNDVLQKAYERAIWVNPDVRSKLISEQQTEAQKTQLAAVQTKATQAKKAAVSIRGASNGSMPPAKMSTGGDVYDDVRNAIHQLRQ